MALADGSNFGPYRILGRLGRGGMATVYRAYEPGLDRTVALKVLPEDSLDNATAVQRFKLEARAVARLVHPNIVPVHAFGIEESTQTPWMALQLIEGGSLAGALAEGSLPPKRALGFLRGIANALDHAHAEGVLHRDVKPQNVLVARGDHVYLADFGLARMLEASAVLSVQGTVLGTPAYMAPEQALGQSPDHRCDIYALGIIAYQMFTGSVPFTADTPLAVLMKHVREPIPIPEMAEPVLRPLLKALAKNRDDRWPTASAFVDALEQGLGQGAGSSDHAEAATVPTVRPAAYPAGGDGERRFGIPPRELERPRPAATASAEPERSELPLRAPLALLAALGLVAGLIAVVLQLNSSPTPSPTAAPTRPLEPRPGESRTFADGAYSWIPGGSFMMGCTPVDSECDGDERPRQRVTLGRGYWMAGTEVTLGQYRRAGKSAPPPGFTQGDDHPVVKVTWKDAEAYCTSIGGRLPTEAEWERAARGGHDDRRYPWGNALSHENANFGADQCCGGLASGRDRWVNTAPVGSFPANDYGLVDMAGNVWEWCADAKRTYGSDVNDPRGSGSGRVLRGGSWNHTPRHLRVSHRFDDDTGVRYDSLGFRCVRDASP